ncbi:hypothetical protein NQ318_015395 [Aromia moschata]|uniref:Peptidase aspartic putative domain-containing protein n=1 Tax=Aromia moschata TaxID=1265417 RepID=A0AAV8YSR0_9CUCU|nr:hypothetical protein NQ318_015395 [Aromia moschata]
MLKTATAMKTLRAVIDDAKLAEQHDERANFDDAYFKITAIAKIILTKYEEKDDNMSVHSSAAAFSNVACGSSSTVDKRIEFVRKVRLCANCLRDNHVTKKCKIGPCTRCKSWHNTLLHQDDHEKNTSRASESNSERQEQKTTVLSSVIGKLTPSYVLLSTARVQVFDRFEKPHFARVLLDSGSQSCFITKSMCERLGLQQENANLSVFGISNARSKIQKKMRQITNVYPKFSVSTRALNIPPDLNLADPEFDKSGPIDILIGAELFWILLKSNKKTCGKNNPILQETELGWIISGLVGEACAQTKTSCNLNTNEELNNILSKFWEIEEGNLTKVLFGDELECENNFSETMRRESDGRFIVTLPLKLLNESYKKMRS